MAITTRKTKTGRIIIESDGCSDYYNGALVQGNIVCKVSVPAKIMEDEDYTPYGIIEAVRMGVIPNAITYYLYKVE